MHDYSIEGRYLENSADLKKSDHLAWRKNRNQNLQLPILIPV